MNEFFCILLSELTILPGAALCFFPMKNQLKTSPGKLLIRILIVLLASASLMAWVTFSFSLNPNTVLLPALLLFYAGYHTSLTVPFSKSLAVYLYVCSLMAILSNFANGFDAIRNPESGADIFSMENSLFQLFLCTVIAILCFYPMQKYGSVLIDRLNFAHVWYMTVPISALFLSINLLIHPQKYQTLYTNNVFLAFWEILAMMIITLTLLTVFFYFIVTGILREAETVEKNRILEMHPGSYYLL